MKTNSGVEFSISYYEPWTTGQHYEQQDPGDYACNSKGNITISEDTLPDKMTMERIVLCINYCQGKSNEELQRKDG
jgi:hypothetical protein